MLIETQDLILSCPRWQWLFGPHSVPLEDAFFRRVRSLRENWSRSLVEVDKPVTELPAGLVDGMTYMTWFLSQRCGSHWYWRVTGPTELLREAAGSPGKPGWAGSDFTLYLCQHEIRGD